MTEPLLGGPKIYFALFGGVRAWRTQQPLDLGPPLRRALLSVLLAADGRTVAVPDLVDLIWGDRPSASARNLLHRQVGALRRTFEPELPPRASGRWLLRTGHGYRVCVDAISCDLRRFRLLTRRAAEPGRDTDTVADLLLQALDLAAGPPGDGLPHPLARAAPFHAIERELVAAVLAAADAALMTGRELPVTPHLVALGARHPLDEPLHARLIDCLAAAGQRAEALAVFAGIRRRLNADLGIEPGRTLGEARRRVLAGAARPAESRRRPKSAPGSTPASSPLPAPPELAGRVRELAAADAALHRPPTAGHRICAVTGSAGAGKTGFALSWAHRVAGRFPDGQFYADLRGGEVEPGEVLRGFLRSLGAEQPARDATKETVAAAFHRAVRGRRLLFVLDDAYGSQQVRELLPADPACLVVATSRNCLTGLIAHEGAQPIPLEPIPLEPDPIEPVSAR